MKYMKRKKLFAVPFGCDVSWIEDNPLSSVVADSDNSARNLALKHQA